MSDEDQGPASLTRNRNEEGDTPKEQTGISKEISRARSKSPLDDRRDKKPRRKDHGFKWKDKRSDRDDRDQDQGLRRGYKDQYKPRERSRSRSPRPHDSYRSERRRDEDRYRDSRDDRDSRRRNDRDDKYSDRSRRDDREEKDEGRPRERRDRDHKKRQEPQQEKKKKPTAPVAPPQEMILVTVNDRLGTKKQVPCLPSDTIKDFKAVVAMMIGRRPHEILLKRQSERPFKDFLTLEDYGISNNVQLDLEVDTGD